MYEPVSCEEIIEDMECQVEWAREDENFDVTRRALLQAELGEQSINQPINQSSRAE